MAESPHIFAATAANFMTDVVEASNSKPVLVDFWAPWCGPCQALMPMLERLADDYAGRFLLAKVNTDEEQQLATHFQVRGIPMLMLVSKGAVAEQLVGVQPEATIKALIDKYLDAEGQQDLPGGEAPGEPPPHEPTPVVVASSSTRPEDVAARLLDQRDAAGAAAAIDSLAADNAEHPSLKALRARLAFRRDRE